MAFSFFRRRKKMVLVVMVLLMVAFLMPTLFERLGGGSGRDATIGYIDDKKVTVHMIRAAEVDLHLLRRSLRMGMGRRTGEGAFAAFLDINRKQDAGLAWTLLVHEGRRMGITIDKNQVDSFLSESGLTGDAYTRELADLRLSKPPYTEKHLRRAVANYLTVMTAFKTTEMNTVPALPELRHIFGDLKERIQLAMVTLPAGKFAADAPEPSGEAVLEQFDRYKHLAALSPDNKTDFGFGYRLPNRLNVAWFFIDEKPIARVIEPPEQQMMEYWRKHKDELTEKVPIPTTSTAPDEDSPGRSETQPSQPAEPPAEPKFREVPFKSFSQAKPQIRRILMPGAVNAKMGEIISLAKQALQRFADTEHPYSAAARAMIHPADALLDRKVASLPFTEASLETVIEELGYIAKVKIVYPFGEHDKLTIDGKIIVKIKPWGGISLGEALERIGKQAKCPPVKWVTCAGMDGVLFASEPVNLVPISAGRTGMTGFPEIHRHELLGRAGLKAGAGPDPGGAGTQSLLSIAVTAEVFQPPGRKHEPLITPGGDFDRAMYVFGERKGRLLWRLVEAEADHAPTHLTTELRKQVIGDLKIVSGFTKALAVAATMKSELEKADADLEKAASEKKLDYSKTEPFARKTLQYQTWWIFPSYVPGVGTDKQFIEQAFTLVPTDPDEPGDEKPAVVIPLRRQKKVMLVQRIGYEPVLEADFAGLVVGRTIVEVPRKDKDGKITMGYGIRGITADEILLHHLWKRTAGMWFSNQSVMKRVNYRHEYPSE